MFGQATLGSMLCDHGTKTWSAQEKPSAQQTERGLDTDYQRLQMLHELGA
jgi:hypothetical protein